MICRIAAAAVLATIAIGAIRCPADETPAPPADKPAGSSIEYVPMDAPPGMAEAVIVQGFPLVHTRQLLPLDREGKLVGEDSLDKQIEQTLDNLAAVLTDNGSGLDKLVRLNVYALEPQSVTRTRELLAKRLKDPVRPAITSVLTSLPHRGAMVAVDAVAASGAKPSDTVVLKRSEAVSGAEGFADAAVLRPGDVAYLSGQPDASTLTETAVERSMKQLMKTLGHLKLSAKDVVHIKVFLYPMTSAEAVLGELQKFFPDQATPPVVFVEWLASMPVEIEMIAQLPKADNKTEKTAENVEFFTPPEVRPSNIFSKVALVHADRLIYISGQYAKKPSRGEPQAEHVFGQLQKILAKTGSDLSHMVKGTYYVCDHDSARWMDRTRPKIFNPERPPAASKLMVHGMGMEGRTMTVDMIAVESKK